MKAFKIAIVIVALSSHCLSGLAARHAGQSSDANGNLFTVVEEIIVPQPLEIFRAMNKLKRTNWGIYIEKRDCELSLSKNPEETRVQIAMLLGVIIADGFLAVQARNVDQVNELGAKALELSKQLGVQDEMRRHCQVIFDSIKTEDWQRIYQEFDLAQRSVQAAMEEIGDVELSQLISIAGWLRGLDIVAHVVTDEYEPKYAELMNQSQMTSLFEQHLNKMLQSKKRRGIPLIEASYRTLHDVTQNLLVDKDLPKPKTVKRTQKICSKLVNSICNGKLR